jgi:inorganic pyrophosphatase
VEIKKWRVIMALEFDVLVEIPGGSRNKYEVSPQLVTHAIMDTSKARLAKMAIH